MAETSRFPHLAPPFAIVGAAAGWLSAGLVANPLVQGAEAVQGKAALIAAGFGALTGALLTRFCVRKRYFYEIVDEGAVPSVPSDRWWRHIVAVLAAGTAAGATIAAACDVYYRPRYGALGGFLCAIAFVPVCAAVIVMARRARRARLGSIVAGSDRRAVWGILATALALATLEAAIDWPAAAVHDVAAPWPAIGILLGTGAVIAAVLAADARALRRAREAIGAGLVERENAEPGDEEAAVPRVDFGLGDDLSARVARSASAYRGRDRTLALVKGNPGQAIGELQRAIRRGRAGLAVVAGVLLLHGAAATKIARHAYDEQQCEHYDSLACGRLAEAVRDRRPARAVALHERACHAGLTASCAAVARMYDGGEGVPPNGELASHFHKHACDGGVVGSCRAFSLGQGR